MQVLNILAAGTPSQGFCFVAFYVEPLKLHLRFGPRRNFACMLDPHFCARERSVAERGEPCVVAEVKAKVPVFEAETHEHFLFELGSIEQLTGWVDKMDKFMSKHEITTGKDNREYHYYQ